MWIKKQQLEPDVEQQTVSKLGKEYGNAGYCHPAYLFYMQSTSCEILVWVKHKLESRFLVEMSIASDTQMIPPLWQKAEELKSLLMTVKEESEKARLKLDIQKIKIMASRWENNGAVTVFIFLGSKTTADGGCNHEIKRHLFLLRKAMANLDSI